MLGGFPVVPESSSSCHCPHSWPCPKSVSFLGCLGEGLCSWGGEEVAGRSLGAGERSVACSYGTMTMVGRTEQGGGAKERRTWAWAGTAWDPETGFLAH